MPIMFVTSLEETEDEAQGFEVGGVDYITKPIRSAVSGRGSVRISN